MRGFKKFISVLIVLILSIGLVSCASPKNKVVATVNGEKITAEEFAYFLTSVKAQIESEQGSEIPDNFWETAEINGVAVIETAKEKALEEAVKMKISRQKAVDMGIKITSEQRQDINNRIGQIVAKYGKDGIDEYLSQFGLNEALYEKQLEDSFYRQGLTEELTKDVNEDNAKEYYKNKVARVKHVLVMTIDEQSGEPLDAEKAEAAKARANELLEKAKSGEDFDKLVEQHSEDPGSTSFPEGYYLGKGFVLGQQGGMVPAFETASLELNVGEVSDIVETNYGYHIIKRYENAESIYDENAEEIFARAQGDKFDELLEGWKSEAKIEKNEKEYNSIK